MIREVHMFTAVCDACGDAVPVDSDDGGYTASHPAHWSHLTYQNAAHNLDIGGWVCCVSCAVTLLRRARHPTTR